MHQERLQRNYIPQEFNKLVMRDSLQRWKNLTLKAPDDLVKEPESFKQNTKWREFIKCFSTFLKHTKGQCNFSLSYVICNNTTADELEGDPEDTFETIDNYEEAIVPLVGPHFDIDNHMVFDSLKSRLLNGPAWTWIQDFDSRRDGRSAWKALQAHYEGVGGQIRMKTAAYASIKWAEYKGAKNFDFDLYKKIHTQAHADLKQYGEPVPETKKVKDFLDGITDASLQPVKFTIAGFPNLMNNFTEASNYIGQIIDLNKKNDAITRSVSAVFADGQNRLPDDAYKGRGRGSGGRGGRGGRGRGRGRGNGKAQNAGHWISSDEWASLPEKEKETIRNQRSQYATKRKLSAITTAATEDLNDQDQGKATHQVDVSSAGDQMSRRNRNLIGQVRSGRRYSIHSEETKEARVTSALHQGEPKVTNAELDSHADTVVAGSTCRILELTDKLCDVYPYSNNYEPIQNVPVAKVATAYDHQATGETFILIFGQALFMGDSMEHTLICPNQARFNGVVIDDVPKHLSPNKSSTHSIFFPKENVRIPLQMNGVISCFQTPLPLEREIQDCRWLVITNDLPWEPLSTQFSEQEAFCQEDAPSAPLDRDIFHDFTPPL